MAQRVNARHGESIGARAPGALLGAGVVAFRYRWGELVLTLGRDVAALVGLSGW